MPRYIHLTDRDQRDAEVAIEGPKRPPGRRYVGPAGEPVTWATLVKTTEGHDYDALLAKFGDDAALSEALVEGDPELDLELLGRQTGPTDRVYIKRDGSILYAARVLEVVYDPAGDEQERRDAVDVEATVTEETALPWTGRLFPIDEVVRRFALVRKLQLRHVNGLTFDFLHEIARALHDQQKMLFLGSGPRGRQPLIFQANGSPYRVFLEGRVDGDAYKLVLHLSNLELKPAATAAPKRGADATLGGAA